MESSLSKLSRKSDTTAAIHYAPARWDAFVRYCDDGRMEIDNSAAERALRTIALGRKNYLFAGSDRGGERAATFYSLIGTAKLNGLGPEAYLGYVLKHIAKPSHHPHRGVAALEYRRTDRKRTRSLNEPTTGDGSVVDTLIFTEYRGTDAYGEITIGVVRPVGASRWPTMSAGSKLLG